MSYRINSILDLRALRIEQLMALRALAGGSMFAHAGGNSPFQVLALHGWGRRGSDFSGALAGLSYLAPDLPGFGASPPPTYPVGARGYADLLAPALNELDPHPVLLGHSFGARVAVALAAANPARFAGLVLTGAPLVRRKEARRVPVPYRMARFGARRRLLPESMMVRMRRRYGSIDYLAAEGVMRQVLVAAVNESYEPELANIAAPVRLVWGENDQEVPVSVAKEAVDMLVSRGGDASLWVVEGVGHQLPLEAPQAIRLEVERILAR
ncbi:MAG: alpha/beta fold hydrolase [Actinomycetota bacterium]